MPSKADISQLNLPHQKLKKREKKKMKNKNKYAQKYCLKRLWSQFCRRKRWYGGKDLQKRKVLNLK